MSEKISSYNGVIRQNDTSYSGSTAVNVPGRLITNRVFVGNIPPNLVERDLILLFHRFGRIRDVKIIPEHTRSKSYGFVTFFNEIDARRAIQDGVMWGDRKLNVAPAVKRNNIVTYNNNSPPVNINSIYQSPPIANSSLYPASQVPMSPPRTMYASPGIATPPDVQQSTPVITNNDPIPVEPNNAMYQTAVICRLPQQFAMTQCHQYPAPTPNAHYFVTPGFQPYVQTGSPIPASHQASHFNSYATSITSVPMTTPCSSTSRDNSIAADVQSDICSDSNSGDIGNNQLEVTSVRDDFNQHNQQHRIPYEHAPVYFLKVFFTPAPLRQ